MLALAGGQRSDAVGLLVNAFSIVLVRAVGHGVTDEALWTVLRGDLVAFVQGILLALFVLAVGAVTRETAVFPRWTGLVALGIVPFLVLGVGSVAGRVEPIGGPAARGLTASRRPGRSRLPPRRG